MVVLVFFSILCSCRNSYYSYVEFLANFSDLPIFRGASTVPSSFKWGGANSSQKQLKRHSRRKQKFHLQLPPPPYTTQHNHHDRQQQSTNHYSTAHNTFTMPQMMRLTSNSIPDASIRREPGENTPTIATTTQYFHQSTISLSHHTTRLF